MPERRGVRPWWGSLLPLHALPGLLRLLEAAQMLSLQFEGHSGHRLHAGRAGAAARPGLSSQRRRPHWKGHTHREQGQPGSTTWHGLSGPSGLGTTSGREKWAGTAVTGDKRVVREAGAQAVQGVKARLGTGSRGVRVRRSCLRPLASLLLRRGDLRVRALRLVLF